MRVDPSAQAAAIAAVSRGSAATGADFSLLLATAKRESGLNKDAHASTSSAAGLFQFVDSTWMNLVQRYGVKHGLDVNAADPAQRQAILNLRYDPDVAAKMAGELAHENANVLQAKLGRTPTAGEVYAAHVLGAGGAARMIRAAESGTGDAAAIAPRAAGANRDLFYKPDGEARTASELMAQLDVAPAAAPAAVQTAISAPAETTVSALSSLLPDTSWIGALGSDLWTLAMRAYRSDETE